MDRGHPTEPTHELRGSVLKLSRFKFFTLTTSPLLIAILVSACASEQKEFDSFIFKEEVRQIVKANTSDAQLCYKNYLRNKKTKSREREKLVLQWNVLELGLSDDFKTIETSFADENVSECLQKKIKTWNFPSPSQGQMVRVQFPFVFQPKDKARK